MARVNIDILGISKLKWTGMGEFNSDDHYIYYCDQESLRRNGVAIMVNKRVQNAVLGCNLKNDRMWRRKWQPTPVLLPGKFHGQRGLVGYSPWNHKQSDTTERLQCQCIIKKY